MGEERFMRQAIEEAYNGVNKGHGGPFGAVVAREGEMISVAHNTVLGDGDPTQHAEMRAISMAAKKLGNFDLSGCEIYSTTEPCPMCFSAIHWARLDRLIFGTYIDDVFKLGFNELGISAITMKDKGASPVQIEDGFMRDECAKLLEYWDSLPDKRVY